MPLRDLFKGSIFAELRWFRRPRKGSSVERTVEALCAKRQEAYDAEGNFRGLPSNKELAEQLGISEATVRQHIEVDAALAIEGLDELPARSRVYLCYWHTKWLDQHATPPTGNRVA